MPKVIIEKHFCSQIIKALEDLSHSMDSHHFHGPEALDGGDDLDSRYKLGKRAIS